MFKILQARLQQYVNHELLDIQGDFRKGRGTKHQISNMHWLIEEEKKIPGKKKKIYLGFTDYATVLDCMDHNKCGKIFKRWEYLTTLTTP